MTDVTITLALTATYPDGRNRTLDLNDVTAPATDGDAALAGIAAALRETADEIDAMLAEPDDPDDPAELAEPDDPDEDPQEWKADA